MKGVHSKRGLLIVVSAIALLLQAGCGGAPSLTTESELFEKGWKLQIPPMEELAAGGIYRVDSDGHAYRVTTLVIPAKRLSEGGIKYKAVTQTSAGALIEFLRIGSLRGDALREIQVGLELDDVVREVTEDVEIDRALVKFWEEVEVRPNNKYYVIRETRAASEVNVEISRDAAQEISGESVFDTMIKAGGRIKSGAQGSIVVQDTYPKRMYIMMYPEEIRKISSALDGEVPKFERFPVNGVLQFKSVSRQ